MGTPSSNSIRTAPSRGSVAGKFFNFCNIGIVTAADAARLAEWEFHNAVLAMKEVVKGQFGSDSDEAQAVGLKKKSDRKRPVRQRAVSVAS